MEATRRFELVKQSDRYAPALLEDEEAASYMFRLYRFLEDLKPGQRFNLTASGDKETWMLVTVGEFMRSEGHGLCYELNADYTKIRRTALPPPHPPPSEE